MKRSKTKKRARILIVDDHPAVREALASRIGRQPDLEVCGEAADTSDALQLIADTRPDMAVVDISLKTGNGIDLIKRIKDRDAKVRMLVWSMHSESLYAERAPPGRGARLHQQGPGHGQDRRSDPARAGRESLLERRDGREDAARAVGRGPKGATRSPLDALADRELEVFRLIGQGVKTAEIAQRLHLSIKTVETYRDRIRQKLDLSDGTELAHYATQWLLEHEGLKR